jgi:hypothetical protein
LEKNLPKPAPLSASDEERFLVPDVLSAVPITEAMDLLREQYHLCKRLGLGPSSPTWMKWAATIMRSWIARIQSEPTSPDLFDRKVFFVLFWNRGMALIQYQQKLNITHPKHIKGINTDAAIMESHLHHSKKMTTKQKSWIESSFKALLPLVKHQVVAFLPSEINRAEGRPTYSGDRLTLGSSGGVTEAK